MKRFMSLVALCLIVSALSACGESNKGTAVSSTGNSSSMSSPTPTQSSKPLQHFKSGETVNVGNVWQIVISNVRRVQPGQYDSLKTGDAYLGIDMNFKNISNKEETLAGSADWTLRDASGQRYNTAYVSDFPTAPDGKIEAGDPAKGSLCFEVPAASTQFTLAFENNLFDSGQTIWDISI